MKTLWKNPKMIAIAIAAILVLIICMQQCSISNLKANKSKNEQNIAALTDSITVTKNKLGQVEYEKAALITDKKGLTDLNKELSKELKAEKGKVAYLQRVVAVITTKYDSIIHSTPIPVYDGDPCDTLVKYSWDWNFDKKYNVDNFRKLSGVSTCTMNKGIMIDATTQIKEDVVGFNIVTGLKKNGDVYEIFIRSDYPGFKPTKIDGAFIPQKDLIPPQKKVKWSIGPTFNIGIGTAMYPKVIPTWYVGVGIGINYSLIRF